MTIKNNQVIFDDEEIAALKKAKFRFDNATSRFAEWKAIKDEAKRRGMRVIWQYSHIANNSHAEVKARLENCIKEWKEIYEPYWNQLTPEQKGEI